MLQHRVGTSSKSQSSQKVESGIKLAQKSRNEKKKYNISSLNMILSDFIVPLHALLSVSHSTLQKNGHFHFRSRILISKSSETCPVLNTAHWQKHLLGAAFYAQAPWGGRQYWPLRPQFWFLLEVWGHVTWSSNTVQATIVCVTIGSRAFNC